MFFRRLMVMLLPPVLLAGLCFLFPYMDGIEDTFFRAVSEGAVLGIALALIFPKGPVKRRDHFFLVLLVPTVLLLAVLVYQYLEGAGILHVEALQLLLTQDERVLGLESTFVFFLLTACFRLL